jgi:hypothetical protein
LDFTDDEKEDYPGQDAAGANEREGDGSMRRKTRLKFDITHRLFNKMKFEACFTCKPQLLQRTR